jgi:hypothetical protein
MYMEEICIIQIQRPSRAGALGPIFIIISCISCISDLSVSEDTRYFYLLKMINKYIFLYLLISKSDV